MVWGFPLTNKPYIVSIQPINIGTEWGIPKRHRAANLHDLGMHLGYRLETTTFHDDLRRKHRGKCEVRCPKDAIRMDQWMDGWPLNGASNPFGKPHQNSTWTKMAQKKNRWFCFGSGIPNKKPSFDDDWLHPGSWGGGRPNFWNNPHIPRSAGHCENLEGSAGVLFGDHFGPIF